MSHVNFETIQQAINEKPLTAKMLDGFIGNIEQLLKSNIAPKQLEEKLTAIADLLVSAVSKAIIDGSIHRDKYHILTAKVRHSAFSSKIIDTRLTALNTALQASIKHLKLDTQEPLTTSEQAAILSIDAEIVEVEPVKNELIIIDKEKGTITMWIKATGKRISKAIKDFRTKSWRDIAKGIIQKIKDTCKALYNGTKTVVTKTVVKPVSNFFSRFKKVSKAQPTPDVPVSSY